MKAIEVTTQALADDVQNTADDLVESITMLISSVDSEESSHDDVATLIVSVMSAVRMVGVARKLAESRVLQWLAENENEKRAVVIGDLKYYGERDKTVKVREFPKALRAVIEGSCLDQMAEILLGDEEAIEQLLALVSGNLSTLISARGLKAGACKKALGADVFDQHWVTKWDNKLAKGEPAKKLGVANTRFVEAAKNRQGHG